MAGTHMKRTRQLFAEVESSLREENRMLPDLLFAHQKTGSASKASHKRAGSLNSKLGMGPHGNSIGLDFKDLRLF